MLMNFLKVRFIRYQTCSLVLTLFIYSFLADTRAP
jgi:hypothetical protein